ncbi:MAG: utilization substance protein [Pseudomonadota bacterium]
MAKISTKTIARIAAIQSLYQFEINNKIASVEQLIKSTIENYSSNHFEYLEIPKDITVKLHKQYFEDLVIFTIGNLNKIDGIIEIHLAKGWSKDSMHIALLSLLRVAIGEILYFPEAPYRVIINEYTNIASDIAKASEISFVNSLLDTVSAEYRPDDVKNDKI